MGQSLNVKVGDAPTPAIAFKNNLIKLLDKAIDLDIEGDRWGYINAVKGLWRMLKRNTDPRDAKLIEAQYQLLLNDIDTIKKATKGDVQKDKETLNLYYAFFDGLVPRIMEAINRAKIIPIDSEGIIVYDDMKSLKEYAKLIRQRASIEEIREATATEGPST